MNNTAWLKKKPETTLDWLILITLSITFYMLLGNFGIFVGGGKRLLGILSPFAGGIVLAYILNPIVVWFTKVVLRGNRRLRGISIAVAYVVFILVLMALGALVVPQVLSSVTMLFNNLPDYIANAQQTLLYLQNNFGIELNKAIEALDSYETLLSELYTVISGWAPQIMSYVGSIAGNAVSLFTAIASSIYMLSDKEKLLRQLRTLAHAFLPERAARNTLDICHFANQNFSGFFIGKIIDSAIIWLITLVSMTLLNMSFAPLISVVVGITNIIPVFGPFIGAIPGLIILLFVSPIQALEFLVLILVIQQLDGNFIGPKILGQSIGISALWVLFSIVLGGDLYGLVGMVLGVPVFATVYGLLRGVVASQLDRRGIDRNGDPLPPVTPSDGAPPPQNGNDGEKDKETAFERELAEMK